MYFSIMRVSIILLSGFYIKSKFCSKFFNVKKRNLIYSSQFKLFKLNKMNHNKMNLIKFLL